MLPSRENKAKQSNPKIKPDNITESQEDIKPLVWVVHEYITYITG